MALKSLRVLCSVFLPSGTIRLWDGSGGMFVDTDGNMYSPCTLTEDALASIESAINAEAMTLSLVLNGVDKHISDTIWTDYKAKNIIDSKVVIGIQPCNEFDEPFGSIVVAFTGRIDNIIWSDNAGATGITSNIILEIINRFTLRTLSSGAVLSDIDQQARSKAINPGLPNDKFCERVPGLRDKTVVWPKWS